MLENVEQTALKERTQIAEIEGLMKGKEIQQQLPKYIQKI